jgi:hypothetical protein
MTYSVEMGSGAMIHMPSFIKNGSGIEKLLRGDMHKDTQTHTKRQQGDHIRLLLFQCVFKRHTVFLNI